MVPDATRKWEPPWEVDPIIDEDHITFRIRYGKDIKNALDTLGLFL